MGSWIPWVERTFPFDTEAALHPELLERLRGAPIRARHLVDGVARERWRRRDGSDWSVIEHVGHLAILDETLFLDRLRELEDGVEVLSPADLTNQTTEEARLTEATLEDVLARFERSRRVIVERLRGCPTEDFARGARHPRLDQPMRVIDMLLFHAEHDDFHLARAREILER